MWVTCARLQFVCLTDLVRVQVCVAPQRTWDGAEECDERMNIFTFGNSPSCQRQDNGHSCEEVRGRWVCPNGTFTPMMSHYTAGQEGTVDRAHSSGLLAVTTTVCHQTGGVHYVHQRSVSTSV